ncbi:MAG: hypothetical protein ACE5FV_11935 [Woeseia sp.]
MKGRAASVGFASTAGILALGYLLASGELINHEFAYLSLLAAFVLSDSSFWPRRSH